MPLLSLKDVGKIYVGENSVAVGIRGINLSFDKGEFVAITGKSGSGKSTLLNVVSGMDTYEEGEMYIEGEPTSHFSQADWETYRQKYISFIFQDYNIIDSFTVLENVELALMHIENPVERRKRAIELLTRVGMQKFLRQRGSKLSGGQKQRTVIARALAKDSPVILADEPTGNLDSETAKEIIELLHEVSRDKLLIVVTHNFEQVSEFATRQIRIYDGGVEFDHENVPTATYARYGEYTAEKGEAEKPAAPKKTSSFKKGLKLGWALFKSMPKLSVFMSIMMIIGAIGLFLAASVFGSAWDIFTPHKMFTHYDGRLIVVKQNSTLPTNAELSAFTGEGTVGAKDIVRCDYLLDTAVSAKFKDEDYSKKYNTTMYCSLNYKATFGDDFGSKIIGRYPEGENEVFLYLPISAKPAFGDETEKEIIISFYGNSGYEIPLAVKAVGVKYYYDNHIEPKMLLTRDGFDLLTYLNALGKYSGLAFNYEKDGSSRYYNVSAIVPYLSNDKKIYLKTLYEPYEKEINPGGAVGTDRFTISRQYSGASYNYTADIPAEYFDNETEIVGSSGYPDRTTVFVSTALIREWMEPALDATYGQASLLFNNDREARSAVQALNDAGYIAVLSDATSAKSEYDALIETIGFFFFGIIMIELIVFFAFFVNLVTRRSIDAFKGDVAIMRSMGISADNIKLGSYFRVMMTVIPAILTLVLLAIWIFTSPLLNQFFTYLYWWQYALIFAGLMLLAYFVTRMQLKRLFKGSVKQTMRGGKKL